jgi:hypothetical protein
MMFVASTQRSLVMKKVSSCSSRVKPDSTVMPTPEPSGPFFEALDTRIALIQALIPIGLAAVAEELEHEVVIYTGKNGHWVTPISAIQTRLVPDSRA